MGTIASRVEQELVEWLIKNVGQRSIPAASDSKLRIVFTKRGTQLFL